MGCAKSRTLQATAARHETITMFLSIEIATYRSPPGKASAASSLWRRLASPVAGGERSVAGTKCDLT
jgi:hypothetical protein